jgi:hypothetical protein
MGTVSHPACATTTTILVITSVTEPNQTVNYGLAVTINTLGNSLEITTSDVLHFTPDSHSMQHAHETS